MRKETPMHLAFSWSLVLRPLGILHQWVEALIRRREGWCILTITGACRCHGDR